MVQENMEECKKRKIDVQIEYLIVNDSPDIIIEYDHSISIDYSLRIIINDTNVGIHQSRVNGIKKAHGDYIIILDQDDVLLPKAVYSNIENIGNSDLVLANGYFVDTKGHETRIYKNKVAHWMATKSLFYECVSSLIVSPGHTMIKKSSIPDVWMKEIMSKNGSDDFFLWLLMFQAGSSISINNQCVYKHIGTEINLSNDRRKMYESSENFCRMAKEKKLFNTSLLRRINRRTEFKIQWNFSALSKIQKIKLMIKNLDIILVNMIYRLFY